MSKKKRKIQGDRMRKMFLIKQYFPKGYVHIVINFSKNIYLKKKNYFAYNLGFQGICMKVKYPFFIYIYIYESRLQLLIKFIIVVFGSPNKIF